MHTTQTLSPQAQVVSDPENKHRIGHEILDFLGGLPLFVTAPLYRHWHVRWGATDEELREPLPGDMIVSQASLNATRAITIDAPPERVWPWIVQMGYRRGGFYTYDLVDNGGFPSAEHVLAQYQSFVVGDWAFPMNGLFGFRFPIDENTAFKVKAFETNSWLLWEKPGSTWVWMLRPAASGRTRLISRQRVHYPELFTRILMEFGDPPMVRRVLKGIRVRAERMDVVQRPGLVLHSEERSVQQHSD
jgi:hypothetical protein